ncbi:adaptor protein MecA [Salisediminibacterium beveridgei]|uniref:Adapter protein MecA n=1 Tax=Salisediminibacterium beveridgei TaxID=632773 RepID=A0A1D7QWI1_9BACI|nr:adaptor protein MecA [Salisediminibacterium beveridgei]AOM83377.1 Negative regulator of genetic competence MecA [Salisediminibacterium beveridgei]
MEIERINETTIKFFITYNDIENRGFNKEEIWYNRDKGEELFFEMMNEVSDQDQFEMNGPLWVQVHALDKGLEVIVTRGQINDGKVNLEIPMEEDLDTDQDGNLADMLDRGYTDAKPKNVSRDKILTVVFELDDLEDFIQFSKNFEEDVLSTLYHYKNKYFFEVTVDDSFSEAEQDNIVSQALEFGNETDVSVHLLKEYGKVIAEKNAVEVFRDNF